MCSSRWQYDIQWTRPSRCRTSSLDSSDAALARPRGHMLRERASRQPLVLLAVVRSLKSKRLQTSTEDISPAKVSRESPTISPESAKHIRYSLVVAPPLMCARASATSCFRSQAAPAQCKYLSMQALNGAITVWMMNNMPEGSFLQSQVRAECRYLLCSLCLSDSMPASKPAWPWSEEGSAAFSGNFPPGGATASSSSSIGSGPAVPSACPPTPTLSSCNKPVTSNFFPPCLVEAHTM